MHHKMTFTVDDTTYQTLRPFVDRQPGQSLGELLGDFARSHFSKPAYNEVELEAGYRAMTLNGKPKPRNGAKLL